MSDDDEVWADDQGKGREESAVPVPGNVAPRNEEATSERELLEAKSRKHQGDRALDTLRRLCGKGTLRKGDEESPWVMLAQLGTLTIVATAVALLASALGVWLPELSSIDSLSDLVKVGYWVGAVQAGWGTLALIPERMRARYEAEQSILEGGSAKLRRFDWPRVLKTYALSLASLVALLFDV